MTAPAATRQSFFLVVPGTPPSVNRYVRHTRSGRHYVTKEAKAFKQEVAIAAIGLRPLVQWHLDRNKNIRFKKPDLRKETYHLEAVIYLGPGQRGDGDNFWKVIADGLVEAGVIHSDAAVTDWILRKRRDRKNPRTEICVRIAE